MFTLEILWGISFFVGVVINTPRTEQFQFLLTYDAFTKYKLLIGQLETNVP